MTVGTHPTVPPDCAIQVAENEGMPTRPNSKGSTPSVVRTRRLTRTFTLGQSKTRAATGGLWSAKEQGPMRHHLTRLIAKAAVISGVIASFAFPVLAQDGTGPIPQNAQARSYGGGWVCDLGFRVEGAECLPLDIPEHAYPTGRSYGTGWECDRGYEEVDRTSCNPIPVPANAFLRSSGYDWQCERGFRQEDEACVPVVLPERAYLTSDHSGTGWTCDRGYEALAGTCSPIAVPENAYLTNADYGAAWACERGFVRIDDRCDAVVVPSNAYLDEASYGPGWSCERGYEVLNGACVAIDLPENAYLGRSGNRWSCNRGFQLSDGACVLGR
ncbi:hypothetical protein OE699_15820 [Sedimentimonas flavescens]|uniref:MSP1 EGF domain 1 n=1 Tax=Sedimentimonas flavescens TaxID=2851012 RepID=A0ABT3A2T4_9RHOB|nr:hypothetical protein [Sedimentimonas flavescens]MCV2880310.1 hypothetical protein [Sedimentimonas flavescens]